MAAFTMRVAYMIKVSITKQTLALGLQARTRELAESNARSDVTRTIVERFLKQPKRQILCVAGVETSVSIQKSVGRTQKRQREKQQQSGASRRSAARFLENNKHASQAAEALCEDGHESAM